MKFSFAKIFRFAERHVLAFGIAFAGALLLIGGIVFVLPRVKDVQARGGLDYQQKKRLYDGQVKYLEDLNALRDQVNAVSLDDIARLNAVVPRGKDIPGIFRQMQSFANDARMSLESVSVSDSGALTSGSATGTGLRSITVSVILSGALDYDGMKNFLKVVSRQAPLLDLTSISHSPASSSSASSYSFSFRSYYFES